MEDLFEKDWKFEHQRPAYAETLIELGKKHPNLVVMDADLSSSTKTAKFGKVFPERFFNVGVAEQNMMTVAAGLATTGKIVVVSTFAVFATGRPYDQIRQSIAYPNLNVKIVASHGGITVGEDGASHQMLEDLALMTTLPNMKVAVPADAPQTRSVVRAMVEDVEGPAYTRMCRAKVPTVTDGTFEFGKGTVMKDGSDVAIISCGIMVAISLKAAKILKEEGIDVAVINMASIKPIDKELIISYAKSTNGIVTAEEHTIYNGLGSRVAEVLVENYPTMMRRVGIEDKFGESGPAWELVRKYGLTPQKIASKVKEIMEVKK